MTSSISSNWFHISTNKLNQFLSPTNHNNNVMHNNNNTSQQQVKKRISMLQYKVQLLDSNNNQRIPYKLIIHLIHNTVILVDYKHNNNNDQQHNNDGTHDNTERKTDTIDNDNDKNNNNTLSYTINHAIPIQYIKQIEWYNSDPYRLVLIIVNDNDNNSINNSNNNNNIIKSQLWDLTLLTPSHKQRLYDLLIKKSNKQIIVKNYSGEKKSHWLNDNYSNVCMNCSAEFSLLRRRSHCRSCGKLFCHYCTSHTSYVPSLGYTDKPVRVCDKCYNTLKLQLTQIIQSMCKLLPYAKQSSIDHTQHSNTHCISFSQLQRIDWRLYNNNNINSNNNNNNNSKNTNNNSNTVRDQYGFRLLNNQLNNINITQQCISIQQQYNIWNTYLQQNNAFCLYNNDTVELMNQTIVNEYRASLYMYFSGAYKLIQQYGSNYYSDLLQQSTNVINHEIDKDILRTFPHHILFESIQGQDALKNVLLAYSLHNTTVSYCQSMNFIAALLLIITNCNEQHTLYLLCIIIEQLTAINNNINNDNNNTPTTIYYYQNDLAGMHIDIYIFDQLVQQYLPNIYNKFNELQLTLLPITINWFLCLFINTLPIDIVLAIFDQLFIYMYTDCNKHNTINIIFATAILCLQLNEQNILKFKFIIILN